MAKKYLLYIHDELFNKELKKSALVNNLLERHYHDTVGGKSQEGIHANIKAAQKALLEAPVPTQDRFIQTPEGIVGPVSLPVPTDRFKRGVCKLHGLPLDGRGRCLQKGCKYS